MSDQTGLVSVLDEGHQRLRALLVALGELPLPSAQPDGDQHRERQRLLRALRREVAELGTIKERFLWSAVRRHFADGDEVCATGLAQKREVEEILLKMRWFGDRDPRLDDMTEQLIACTRRHIDYENTLMERFATQLPVRARQQVVAALRNPPRLLPTRSHPDLPTAPWAAAVLGPVVGLVDRLRDGVEPAPSGA